MDKLKQQGILERVSDFLEQGYQNIEIIVRGEGYSIIPTKTTNINKASLEGKDGR